MLFGSDDDYDYEELIEIQIIQRINKIMKELEHKLYDFLREKYEFLEIAKENKKLFESFQKSKLTYDIESADHLSNSNLSKLQSVQSILIY